MIVQRPLSAVGCVPGSANSPSCMLCRFDEAIQHANMWFHRYVVHVEWQSCTGIDSHGAGREGGDLRVAIVACGSREEGTMSLARTSDPVEASSPTRGRLCSRKASTITESERSKLRCQPGMSWNNRRVGQAWWRRLPSWNRTLVEVVVLLHPSDGQPDTKQLDRLDVRLSPTNHGLCGQCPRKSTFENSHP